MGGRSPQDGAEGPYLRIVGLSVQAAALPSAALGQLSAALVQLTELRCLYVAGIEQPSSLPDSIGQLSHLRALDITNSQGLGGTLPPSLGLLTDLRWLTIKGTRITGTLPEAMFPLDSPMVQMAITGACVRACVRAWVRSAFLPAACSLANPRLLLFLLLLLLLCESNFLRYFLRHRLLLVLLVLLLLLTK
jgi:hypothetical protein